MDKQATKIYDALRYTAYIKNPDQFVNSYNTIKLNLKKMGYDIVRVKNTINKYTIKNPYRGVNVVVQTKQGYKFELQFHTPKSLEIKEVNHMLYKQVSSTNSQARNNKLYTEMYNNSKQLQDIKDGGTIESFDLIDKKRK